MYNFYKYSFNFNASHSFNNGNIHAHTFRVILYIEAKDEIDVSFYRYENLVDNYFASFRGKYLNELAVFKNLVPTLENMALVFYEKINEILIDCNLDLRKLEIGDDYTTSVSIGEIIITGSNMRIIDEEKFVNYKKKILQKYGFLNDELVSDIETIDNTSDNDDIVEDFNKVEIKHFIVEDYLLFDNFIKRLK